jgi:hypothetical protein
MTQFRSAENLPIQDYLSADNAPILYLHSPDVPARTIGGQMGITSCFFPVALIGDKWKASIQLAAQQRISNKMKRALLLCATISAAIILVGCANKNSSATASGTTGFAEQGVPGTGGGGGGLGGAPGRNTIHTLP